MAVHYLSGERLQLSSCRSFALASMSWEAAALTAERVAAASSAASACRKIERQYARFAFMPFPRHAVLQKQHVSCI
jgi:hypothetical protein